MLTRADDYPVHQTPEPVAHAGSDRNFYDRYFFNGYDPEGQVFFAAALGVYPNLNVMDAAVSVRVGGVQHNLRASKLLRGERLDLQVGPISLEIVEPLRQLRLRFDSPQHGMRGDVLFVARAGAIEEPRFTYKMGPRTVMDYTRLTQNGVYSGWIEVAGTRLDLSPEIVRGTRDRSWGVRPVGAPDSQPVAPPVLPQFYWLWAPCNFDALISLFHINADAEGHPWNTRGVIAAVDGDSIDEFTTPSCDLQYRSGTRRIELAVVRYRRRGRDLAVLELQPQFHFYMPGIGYMHPEWGHGVYRGELAVGYDTYDLASVDDGVPAMLHVQAFCQAHLTLADGSKHAGQGVLEQLIVGPHAPSGFRELFDTAP